MYGRSYATVAYGGNIASTPVVPPYDPYCPVIPSPISKGDSPYSYGSNPLSSKDNPYSAGTSPYTNKPNNC